MAEPLRRQGHRHPDDQSRSRLVANMLPEGRRDVCRPHRRKPGGRRDLRQPRHPYRKGSSIPPRLGERSRRGQQRLREISGVVPSIRGLPGGCRFKSALPGVTDICRSTAPDITPLPADGLVRCHHHG